jgi:tRNA dimethylallyltransferase
MGNTAFHARLAGADPASAKLSSGDTHRILRAWEVLQATGAPLSFWQSQRPQDIGWRYQCLAIVPPRDDLYRACNERFRHMVALGALQEVEAIIQAGGSDWPVLRTLGAKPLQEHLQGAIDLETAIDLGQTATRHYAKRQTTWFRNRFLRNGAARIFSTATEILTSI